MRVERKSVDSLWNTSWVVNRMRVVPLVRKRNTSLGKLLLSSSVIENFNPNCGHFTLNTCTKSSYHFEHCYERTDLVWLRNLEIKLYIEQIRVGKGWVPAMLSLRFANQVPSIPGPGAARYDSCFCRSLASLIQNFMPICHVFHLAARSSHFMDSFDPRFLGHWVPQRFCSTHPELESRSMPRFGAIIWIIQNGD